MSRFNFAVILLLTIGILVAGMAITAHSLEELGSKPVTVLAVDNQSSHTTITLLGTDYDFHLSKFTNYALPPDFTLERALLWCQELAFVRALDMPRLP